MSDVVGGWSGSLVSTESGRDGQVKMEKREGERDREGEKQCSIGSHTGLQTDMAWQ